MPTRPPHPCNQPGCGTLTHDRFCRPHTEAYHREIDAVRGSAHQRGYGIEWRRLRAQVLAEERRCRACGQPGSPSDHVDHIVAKRHGGTDERANLQRLCGACHRRKDANPNTR